MKPRVRFAAIVAVLALVIGFASERYLAAGLSFDALLTLRHAVFGDRHQAQDGEVVVVNIDEDTFKTPGFQEVPWAFWGPRFATVLDAIDRADAKVIGADIIFSATAEKVVRGHDRPFFEVVHRLASQERIVLASTDIGAKVVSRYLQPLVGYQRNIRSVNVPFSRDGVVRSVSLWQSGGGDGAPIPTFALTLAQRAGFDPERMAASRFLNPNYADAVVAPVYTFQDVFRCAEQKDGEALKAAFAGKIVLVGASIDYEDRKVTPGRAFVEGGAPMALRCGVSTPGDGVQSRRTIPGVFIHAQAVNDLLRGEVARFWPLWIGVLALAGMSTIGSALAIFLRAQTASLLLAGALLLWLAGTTASASLDWFAPLLGGVASAVAAFLIGLGLRTFVIDRERRRMALALSRYLDIHLAQQLIASDNPPKLGGETREVTIWFSDIAGFSTLAEHMDAKELVTQLNAHFTLIGQAIEAEGGIIDKYVGDAVVAIFGALVPLPNHAASAMRAALKVQEKLRAEAGREGAFRIRIGLNTGSCVVGNVGSINRINYTAIGDSVNVAARLEAANKELGTAILASDATVQAAGKGFLTGSLGAIHVKGRVESVTVHEVLASTQPDLSKYPLQPEGEPPTMPPGIRALGGPA
jgi:adenylate cyclase